MPRRRRSNCAAPAASGQFVSYAGSDIARGETLLRRGTQIGSREIGMLAACGLAAVETVRRPRVAVLSTGDELVEPGRPLRPGGVYDSNGAIIAAAIVEAGGEPVPFGAFPDEEITLELAMRSALETCDMVVLSGGTSKGAGDLSHRIVSRLGKPGILVHGVALKPGKPLCLAVIGDKPLVVLPGFPTSAIFTFHAFVAPLIRARAGLPPEGARTVAARVPVRIASELGREEFVLVSLVAERGRPDRVSDRQRVRRGDGFFPGRRIFGDRCARLGARCRYQGRGHADRRDGARARSRHHGKPRCRARRRCRRARRARLSCAYHRRRQSRRRCRGGPRPMRCRAGSSRRSGERHLQQASSVARPCARSRLAAHAGFCLSPG